MPEILAPLLVKGKPFSAASVAKTVRASCGDSYQFAEGGIIIHRRRPIDDTGTRMARRSGPCRSGSRRTA